MTQFEVINAIHVKEIADVLNLSEWLVEALIVEYLPCRHFLENDSLVLLDFNLITEQDIQQIELPYVILNGIVLVHNAISSVFKDRMLAGIANLPMTRTSTSSTTFIPEGQVSPSYQLFFYEPIGSTDWKMELSVFTRALVIAEDGIFQWSVTGEALISVDTSQKWYTSEIFSNEQLEELRRIHDEFHMDIGRQPFPTDEEASLATRKRLEKLYEDLETLKAEMRQTVLKYHNYAKQKPEARAAYTEETPPLLTIFDEAVVQNGSFKIRSYMEPLFFRAAYRASTRAESANSIARTGESSTLAISEEIEASAESIVLSAMCLEAYINGFAQDHLAHLWTKDTERMEAPVKWLIIPAMLGKPDCFSKRSQPYQDFMELIRWRNNSLAHYKHELQDPDDVPDIGKISKIYAICNVAKANKAIDVVRRMIERLNEHLGFQTPAWVRNQGMWLRPANIDLEKRVIGYSGSLE